MIKHIHETVFILLHDYHFDEITVQKYVILQKSTAVRSTDTSKINMNYSTLYLTFITQQIIAKGDTSADITTLNHLKTLFITLVIIKDFQTFISFVSTGGCV